MSKEAEERAYKKNREDRCIEMAKVSQAIEIKRAESAYNEDLASGTSKAIAAKRRTQRLKKTQKMLSKRSIAKCLHVLPDISSKYGYFHTIEQYKTFVEHQHDPITMVDNSAVCKEILNIKLAAYKEFQKILSKHPSLRNFIINLLLMRTLIINPVSRIKHARRESYNYMAQLPI